MNQPSRFVYADRVVLIAETGTISVQSGVDSGTSYVMRQEWSGDEMVERVYGKREVHARPLGGDKWEMTLVFRETQSRTLGPAKP
jgi:hypothetical protein